MARREKKPVYKVVMTEGKQNIIGMSTILTRKSMTVGLVLI